MTTFYSIAEMRNKQNAILEKREREQYEAPQKALEAARMLVKNALDGWLAEEEKGAHQKKEIALTIRTAHEANAALRRELANQGYLVKDYDSGNKDPDFDIFKIIWF